MKTNSKKRIILVSILSLLMALAVALGIVFTNNTSKVKAESETYLNILDGISIKLDTKNDVGGMRFEAEMDKATGEKVIAGTYTMYFVIAPTAGFDYYYNQSKTFIDMADDGNAIKISVEVDKVYADNASSPTCYYAQACLTNIKEANRNLSFEAGAYIVNGESETVIYTERNSTAVGTFYDKTNLTVLGQNLEETIMSMTAYNTWYGKASYPVYVTTQKQFDTLVTKCNNGNDSFKGLTTKYDPANVKWDSSKFTDEETKPEIPTIKVYDFEDGLNPLFSAMARGTSAKSTWATLEVVNAVDTSENPLTGKVTGKALRITPNADCDIIAILDTYLDNVFADETVSSIAFDVYYLSGTNTEGTGVDIRYSTSAGDNNLNYRYTFPRPGALEETLFITRENYNDKCKDLYNGFREIFLTRYINVFYIDNVRVCKGATAQINQYYTFENASVRHLTTDGTTGYIYSGVYAQNWQISLQGINGTITHDTTVTNNCATSIKLQNISSSVGINFNSSKTTWYDVFKNGLSIDIYSTVDIPYGSIGDAIGYIGEVKANTWTTLYIPQSHLADVSKYTILTINNVAGADIYLANLKTATDEQYQKASLGFEQGRTSFASNTGYYFVGAETTSNYSLKVANSTILTNLEISSEKSYTGNNSLKITKVNGYLPFTMNTNSYFYNKLKNGFTVWVYSTVALNSHKNVSNIIDGMNGKIMYNNETEGIDIKANEWTQITIGKDQITSDGRWLILSGSTAGDIYFDDFAPLDETTSCVVTFSYVDSTGKLISNYYPRSKVVATGETVEAVPADRIVSGKTFKYWATDMAGENEFDFDTPITTSIRLFAIYESDICTVTFDTDGGLPVPSVQQVENGNLATKPATDPVKEGTVQYSYSFAYWTADGETEFDFSTSITGNITLTAVYTETLNKYTVTIQSANTSYGTVNNSTVANVPYGTVLTTSGNVVSINGTNVTATPNSATAQYTYAFESWTNGTATVTDDLTVTANFTRALNKYDVTVNRDIAGVTGDPYVYEDIEYGTKLDLTKLNKDYCTYKLYSGEEEISEYTVTGEATLKAVYTYVVFDFEDGTNTIMSEIARKSSSAGSGHTLTVEDFTGTSDKVTGKALKVVTVNQDLGDIAILDSYLSAVFSDPNVSSVAFDVYLETYTSNDGIDIRMSTSSTDANLNYRYLYPKQYETGTIFYTRENYNQKSNYIYNGFRQMFFNRWTDTFYIDNVRVCLGETAEINQYYTFEQTALRHLSTDGGASYIYPGNLPGTWQIAVTGNTNGITFDTTRTNNCATSIKISNISSDSVSVQFNSTSNTWYDVFKNGLSIDIYSTVDIAYGNIKDGVGNLRAVKANTWTTLYITASHLESSRIIFKVLNSAGANIYFCNLKTATFESKTVTFDSNGGTSTPEIQTVEYGTLLTKPTDPKKTSTAEYSYTFIGWFNGDTEWNFTENVVTSDITLTAHYTQAVRTYTINFDEGVDAKLSYEDSLERTLDEQTVKYGEAYTLPTATASYRTFEGWYLSDGTKIDETGTWLYNIPNAEAIILTAKYTYNTITFDSDDDKKYVRSYTSKDVNATDYEIAYYSGSNKLKVSNTQTCILDDYLDTIFMDSSVSSIAFDVTLVSMRTLSFSTKTGLQDTANYTAFPNTLPSGKTYTVFYTREMYSNRNPLLDGTMKYRAFFGLNTGSANYPTYIDNIRVCQGEIASNQYFTFEQTYIKNDTSSSYIYSSKTDQGSPMNITSSSVAFDTTKVNTTATSLKVGVTANNAVTFAFDSAYPTWYNELKSGMSFDIYSTVAISSANFYNTKGTLGDIKANTWTTINIASLTDTTVFTLLSSSACTIYIANLKYYEPVSTDAFTNPYENSNTQFDFYGYSGASNGTWRVYTDVDDEDVYTTYSAEEDFRTLEQFKQYKEAGMTLYLAQDSAPIDNEARTSWSTSKTKRILDLALEAGFDHASILTDGTIQSLSKYPDAGQTVIIDEEEVVGHDVETYIQETYSMTLTAYIEKQIKVYANHDAVCGVMLGDEPFIYSVSNYGKVYRALKTAWKNVTGRDCYIQYNLLPDMASLDALDQSITEDTVANRAQAYKNYLEAFISSMGLEEGDMLQFDDYPLFMSYTYNNVHTTYNVRQYYLMGIKIAAEIAKAHGLELSIVTQTMNMIQYASNGQTHTTATGTEYLDYSKEQRYLNKDELYWLNNMLVGYGVKTISYFTFWTKASNSNYGETFKDGGSFMTHYGQKTSLYYDMQQIMAEEQELAKVLGNFSYSASKIYTGDYVNGAKDYYKSIINYQSLYSTANFKILNSVSVNRDYTLVTELYDSNLKNYVYMLQNVTDPMIKTFGTTQTVTIYASGYKNDVIIYRNGVASKGIIDSNGKMTFKLDPGEAVYILFETDSAYVTYDFEDGQNNIISEIARGSSSAGSGHTLSVVDFTGTSDKVTGKALKVVTTSHDLGDLSILDSYLTTVFSDPNVSAIAFDVYLETQASSESIDIRMSTSSTDANTNYRYLYPKQGGTGTIFYTREMYEDKSTYVYNGFRQFFFNRYEDTFYIDNIRVCKGSVQDNYYYGFEQTCIGLSNTTVVLYSGNTPTTWQLRGGGASYTMSLDSTITNNSATSLKTVFTGTDEKQFVFNTSGSWYTALKNGFSFDIYSTVDIPCASLCNNGYSIYGNTIKANTWTTVYVSASDMGTNGCFLRIKTGIPSCTIYLDNLTAGAKNSFGFEDSGTVSFSSNTLNYYTSKDSSSSTLNASIYSYNSTYLTSASLSTSVKHAGTTSLSMTKKSGCLPFYMKTGSYFYSQLKHGFTFWIYSTVAISSSYLTDGRNASLGVSVSAKTWTQITINPSQITSDGRFFIITGGVSGTIYFDDFQPL